MLVQDNDVTYLKGFHWIAIISHTGKLNRGHFTLFVKMPNS